MTVERKLIEFECYCCDGKGKINKKKCKACSGTGIYKESHYYFIDEKTGIAFSGDTVK